jgi:hypothetical protein
MNRPGLACAFFLSAALPAAGCGGCGSSSVPSTGEEDGGTDGAAFDVTVDSASVDTGPTQDSSPQEAALQDSGSTPDAGPDQATEAASDAAPDQTAPESGPGDAGSEAGTEGGADATPEGDGGPACIGNVSIDFSSLAPDWVNDSTACGTAATSNDSLVLTRNAACTTDPSGGAVSLSGQLMLCGDFDIQVAYDLTTFPYPTSGGRYASVRAYDPLDPTNGIALERFDNDACTSVGVAYKSWTTDSSGCVAVHVPTTDTSGTMRLTRSGATVTSYFLTPNDAGPNDAGGSWTQVMTDTLTTTPWSLELYTGYNPPNAGDTNSQSVSFSNMVIRSASMP